MIVLDTNVISELFKVSPDARVIAWLNSLNGDVGITAITLAELLAGVGRLPEGRRKSALRTSIEEALRPYRESRAILSFDDTAAAHYAEVLVARERTGQPISMADAQMAAICRANGATCATRNTKDLVHTGVQLIDPWIE